MKKHFEQEEPQAVPAQEPDVLGMLKKIQQHLVFLERKIDALMERSPGGSVDKGRNFLPHRKPFGNSFRQDRGNFRRHTGSGGYHGGHRPEGNRSFGDRPRGHEDRPHHSREGSFEKPIESEGERSFRSKRHFPRHRGPKRHF